MIIPPLQLTFWAYYFRFWKRFLAHYCIFSSWLLCLTLHTIYSFSVGRFFQTFAKFNLHLYFSQSIHSMLNAHAHFIWSTGWKNIECRASNSEHLFKIQVKKCTTKQSNSLKRRKTRICTYWDFYIRRFSSSPIRWNTHLFQ